ncbi:Sua5/YciO/YrdC/YwlC family protein [Mycoplasmopsis meleagridis]|uniref:Sua5/YciO/YrdC/YwlC family protein n=1 Tax=Mycoplasmopsis meleagridis TaxID=29561 RepID=UPI00073D677B|nr:Sua5/YciO/YrdC/YwlC family protein [Mycoplasmopsis meleagridis]KUH47439.1 SUA5-like translation suppressor [Mycoplasmopsis meleagridis]
MNFKEIFICNTDTVCGIGGPVKKETLEVLYFLKKRPKNKKIMILVGSIEQAKQFKEWNMEATNWALKYWPGAYSIIVNGQGFRMPNNKELCDFLLTNGPMYVTSANISGKEPIQIEDAKKIFPQIKNIYRFKGNITNKASEIFDIKNNKWIR